jgi:plastocyanin
MRPGYWFGLAIITCLAGCGGDPPPEPPPAAEATVQPAAPSPAPASNKPEDLVGIISGQVTFEGDKPVVKPISMDAVPACAKQHPARIESEEVFVNGNGTLRNVFIHLKSGVPAKAWPVPATPVLLDQKGCLFSPRVVVVHTGQTLEIGNADPMMHNVHPLTRLNEEFNVAQPPQGERLRKQFVTPEVMIPMVCNMHPWMKAFVNVVNHPFYAVTGSEGTFKLAGVPPGRYEIEAVHERLGAKTLLVTVGAREEQSVQFSFRSN